jgi:DNA-3-methyladenine glycosylase I
MAHVPGSVAEVTDVMPIRRCDWCLGSEAYIRYHDVEWGVPVHDDQVLFEFLLLEGAQAGLSWSTILAKRENYRRLFAGFEPAKVARFTPARVGRLLADPGIVRHRLKVESAVSNARAFLAVQAEFGSFAAYAWGFVDGQPVQNRWRTLADVPASTPISDALSRDLKHRGFRFVGSTIIYAFMQATGLVNDHLTGCYRYRELRG